MKRPTEREMLAALGKIQDLVGSAMSAYHNDQDPMRADNVINPLQKAFELCVHIRSRFPIDELPE